MKAFEYIRLNYDGSLEELNALASTGWHVVAFLEEFKHFILEREIPEGMVRQVREFYSKRQGLFDSKPAKR